MNKPVGVNSLQFYRSFRRDPLGNLEKIAAAAGDRRVVRWRVGWRKLALVLGPEAVQEVLVTKAESFHKGLGLERAKVILGEGLLTSENSVHKRSRKIMQPAFRREAIAGYAESMAQIAAARRDAWNAGATVDIHREMLSLTLQTIGRTMFGKDLIADARELGDAIAKVIDAFPLTVGFPFPTLLRLAPLPANAAKRVLNKAVTAMIRERRLDHREEKNDLLAMLVAATDEEGGLSIGQLRDETMTIFLAGHETIAGTLSWAWHFLAQNPDAETLLHREVDAVLGGRPPTAEEAMRRLPWTHAVISETLRLHPAAWIIGRRVIEPVRIAGEKIEKGVIVLVSQWLAHRDAEFFPEPRTFRPERWTPEFRARLPRFAYFPFGGGPRQCIGEHFAWMEGVILLATLAQKWRLEHTGDPKKVELQASITLRPRNGIPMRLVRRTL